jgi:hypothetical protein
MQYVQPKLYRLKKSTEKDKNLMHALQCGMKVEKLNLSNIRFGDCN